MSLGPTWPIVKRQRLPHCYRCARRRQAISFAELARREQLLLDLGVLAVVSAVVAAALTRVFAR